MTVKKLLSYLNRMDNNRLPKRALQYKPKMMQNTIQKMTMKSEHV